MARKTLGPGASFLTASAVVAHTIWTSAAPALTYPLYASEWHLTTFSTTAIFAIYPVFVVMTLVLFGNLSDHIGRRDAMLLGLAASAGGALIFVAAPDVGWIFSGRALMGIGVGLSAGPSAAAVRNCISTCTATRRTNGRGRSPATCPTALICGPSPRAFS